MFEEPLTIKLSLTIAGTAINIPGSRVEGLSLQLDTWGFHGRISFSLRDSSAVGGTYKDKLLKPWTTQDLVELSLELSSDYQKLAAFKKPFTLKLAAIGLDKELREDFTNYSGDSLSYIVRTYSLKFADAASVLWPQHFPCELYVDKDMKTLIDAQKNAKIKLDLKAAALKVKHAILTLPLGGHRNQASFYDFIHWYCDFEHIAFNYDYDKKTYILDDKRLRSKELLEPYPESVENLRVILPEAPRYAVQILNADSEQSSNKKDVENKQAVTDIRRDMLVRTGVAKRFNDRATLEGKRLAARKDELSLRFSNWPHGPIVPTTKVKFTKKGWAEKAHKIKDTWVIQQTRIQMSRATPSLGLGDADTANFESGLELRLEAEAEAWIPRPAYTPPDYPIQVEGKIVSDKGKKEEETWQFFEDKDSSLEVTKVEIPLWEKQKVIVNFAPEPSSSQVYMPPIKGARVLVELHFKSAEIVRHLAWRAGARLPQDSQGNHILFGLTDESKTSVQHLYEKDKPVLFIKRTNKKDTELIRMEDGTMILQTKEE